MATTVTGSYADPTKESELETAIENLAVTGDKVIVVPITAAKVWVGKAV